MNDSDFNKVLLLRIRILPPYTYDEDEDERDISEYLAFYKQNLDMSIDSAKKYIEAISCFRDEKLDLKFEKVLEARKAFIKLFPFAYDELESEEVGFGTVYMRKIYENDTETKMLERDLEEYVGALLNIKSNC